MLHGFTGHRARQLVCTALLAAGIVCLGFYLFRENRSLKDDAARLVTKSVPTNANEAAVVQWLDSIEATYDSADPDEDLIGHESVAQLSGLPVTSRAHVIRARMPLTQSSLFSRTHVDVYFFFDREGQLKGTYVTEVRTAL